MFFVNISGKFRFLLLALVSISIVSGTLGAIAISAADDDRDSSSIGDINERRSYSFGAGLASLANTLGFESLPAASSNQNHIAAAPIFDEFNAWINLYLNNNYKANAEQVSAGAEAAKERLRLLKELVRTDPKSALEKAIPAELSDSLPTFITDNAEKRISAKGDFLVYQIDEIDGQTQTRKSRTERFVVIGGVRYKAVVYGRRESMTTKLAIPLQGIIVDGTMALDEAPARIINEAEYAKFGIDGSKMLFNETVAEIGGEIVRFANKVELNDFVGRQISRESRIGPVQTAEQTEAGSNQEASSAWTEGAKKVLVLRVDFPDAPGAPLDHYNQPLTEARALSLISGETSNYYRNSSYNKTSMIGTVTPVLRLPQTKAYYAQGSNFNIMLDDARAAAAAVGLNTANFDLDLLCFSYTPSIGWVGIAAVGYKGALLNGAFYMPEAAHELGHNYGLLHANLWRASGSSIGPGYNVEYGDCYDNMGACVNGNEFRQFNARYKRLLDWLTEAEVQTVTATGTYRIFAQDSNTPGGLRALKIAKDPSKNYWIEFRQLISGSAKNGALIRWDYSSQSFRETQVLDMTPATTASGDEPLLIGQSFEDATSQIKITVLGKGGTTPESLDIKVELAGSATPTPTPSCTYSITPAIQNFGASGGTGSVSVTTQSGCAWAASSNQNFATISSGAAGGVGSGTVSVFVAPNAGAQRSGTLTIASQTFTVNQSAAVFSALRTAFDYDGDGKSDVAVFRPTGGFWYLLNSASGFSGVQFGITSDKIVPADYDGDGKTDIAVFRDGVWYLNRSAAGFTAINFGAATDIPQPADFDGDGRAELTVWRPSSGTWYIYNLATNQFSGVQFGALNDKPVAGDYDGDGRADTAVYRPASGFWYIQRSSQGFVGVQFGDSNDKPIPADYDGDGKTDVAVYRPSNGTWYLNRSQAGFAGVQFGVSTDLPAPADYDGDGKTDFAVFRNGTWYLQQSAAGFTGISFGLTSDKPIANAFVF